MAEAEANTIDVLLNPIAGVYRPDGVELDLTGLLTTKLDALSLIAAGSNICH